MPFSEKINPPFARGCEADRSSARCECRAALTQTGVGHADSELLSSRGCWAGGVYGSPGVRYNDEVERLASQWPHIP